MNELEDDFFRREYGRLVAMLSRRVGTRHLDLVEDAVQFALAAAVETWPSSGGVENRSAWLFRVAHNHVVGELRRLTRRAELGLQNADLEPSTVEGVQALLPGDVRDDVLRMLFACCNESIPVESQLVLALKVLCGFDAREISERLFTSEANVYKRLGRAKSRLREVDLESDSLGSARLVSRLPAVQSVLYVLFTEGYLSSHAEGAIRRDLCDEALRLTEELAQHPAGATPETHALLALMRLHNARMPARQDGIGGLMLLDEQDRTLWDTKEIEAGLCWLARSASGTVFSRYHAEAGIAAEHCLARTLAETRWERIVECYALLERSAPSPLHTLNRALAVAEWQGPQAGLDLLEGLAPPSWLLGSHLWTAVFADLHRRAGNVAEAQQYRTAALAAAPSKLVREALARRLEIPAIPTRRGDVPPFHAEAVCEDLE
ncbi:MAG TPA: sigma-70 family RNA polymerase sigma factor [Polyangiaceae bacterium]